MTASGRRAGQLGGHDEESDERHPGRDCVGVFRSRRTGGAVAQVSRRRAFRAPPTAKRTCPRRRRDAGRETGSLGFVAAGRHPDRGHCHQPSARLGTVSAVGREAVQGTPRQRRSRRSDGELHRRRRAALRPGAVSVQDPAREESCRDPLRGRALVPADLRRWPVAAGGHEPVVVRVFSRTVGQGHLRRRDGRIQRQGVARQLWQACDRQAARHREVSCARTSGTWTSSSPSTIQAPTRSRGT